VVCQTEEISMPEQNTNYVLNPPTQKLSRLVIIAPQPTGATLIIDVVGFSLPDIKDEMREFDAGLLKLVESLDLVNIVQRRRESAPSR
jgi:hypothetical protein